MTSYTVVSGDCLWNIAYKLYGSGARWTEAMTLFHFLIVGFLLIFFGHCGPALCPRTDGDL